MDALACEPEEDAWLGITETRRPLMNSMPAAADQHALTEPRPVSVPLCTALPPRRFCGYPGLSDVEDAPDVSRSRTITATMTDRRAPVHYRTRYIFDAKARPRPTPPTPPAPEPKRDY
ncbi:hypothetical protein SKAU_G00394930 [Synaphobranchus kaupii]|uniref:Uncharacterized protein n=1 Tax=Synaphobranchus kaupii TaxID=118154 RepID=A0A9Q1ID50_SYNKA|nr:hypothetical protein SKAU_G00394930 [Synaphobranchus kaupii]